MQHSHGLVRDLGSSKRKCARSHCDAWREVARKTSGLRAEMRGAICDIRGRVRAACNRHDAPSKRGIDKHGLQHTSEQLRCRTPQLEAVRQVRRDSVSNRLSTGAM